MSYRGGWYPRGRGFSRTSRCRLDMPTFADQLVTPRNCSFAVGFPSSHEEFRTALGTPYDSFAKLFFGGWQQYKSELLGDLMGLFTVATDLCVSLTTKA